MQPKDMYMIKLIKGFHDILPDETPKWSFLLSSARNTLERFGYREIIPPIMERTELFVRGIGEVTDIVEKEMYTFEDRNGENLTLRPEATAGILRAVAEHSLLRKDPVLKMYAVGPMFRRERPQKGRFRQFFQVDAEVLGDDSPYTDAEVIAAAHAVVTDIGGRGLIMEVNSLGCPNCRKAYREELSRFIEKHLGELCGDCRRRYAVNPLRVLDCKVDRCAEIAAEAPVILNSLDNECRRHFDAVQDALGMLGIPFRVNPRIVRGLDYYTRTAFEIIHEEFGSSKAVGGGGRYDNLLKELGGPAVSGIGFGIGLERLALVIPDNDERFAHSTQVYVAPIGENALETAFRLVNQLRSAGISAETRYSSKSLKANMKIADRVGARKVIMIGDDELSRNEVTIRDMLSGKQESVKMEKILQHVQGDKE